ncbi:MAG: phytanoyl-CoA dioxygenase family protein [Lentisphaerae bacterium]|nr:phytanoyl-CoA dioxygenase family protein [Lentisphaerota bacterium]
MSTTDYKVPQDQIDQYNDEGYMILEGVIPAGLLTILREECSYFMGYCDAEMDARQVEKEGLNYRRNRYFIGNRYHTSPRLWRFIYSNLMAEVSRAALGPNVQLFNEQWVVKAAEKGGAFSWHQDSGYVKHGDAQTTHRPYLTCWCTLDDVSEANGSVYLLPHSRGGTKDHVADHVRDAGTNDLVGYRGDDPGISITAPAGSIVAFTSYNFHRSGRNTTPHMRRVYLTQYSAEPILKQDGGLWGQAVPFLENGDVVYDYAADMAARTQQQHQE